MARFFNGTTDLINCGLITNLMGEDQAVSIAAWIKPVSLGESSLGYIVGRANTTDAYGFLMVATSTIELFIGGSTALVRAASDNSVTLGVWQHVALTHDGSSTAANAHIYVNGIETAYKTTTNGVTPTNNAALSIIIGNRGNAARTFNGSIAYVQIFDRQLSSEEIRGTMYSPGSIKNGLRRYYPLHGFSSPEPNLSGFDGPNSNGALTGTTLSSGPPIGRFGLNRRGLNRVVQAGGAGVLTINESLSITFSEQKAFDVLKVLAETLTLSHPVFFPAFNVLKTASDSITLTESQFKNVLKSIAQSVSITESTAFNFLKVISETVSISDSDALNLLKALSDSLTISETRSSNVLINRVDSLTLTESRSSDLIKVLTENLSITESQAKDFLKVISEAIAVSESSNVSLVGAVAALITFLLDGNIKTHDKLVMKTDQDEIVWDWHE